MGACLRPLLLLLLVLLQDAMGVARNIMVEPRLVPGGGAVEMAVSRSLAEASATIEGVEAWPFKAAGQAAEVIPRTLAQNCGANVIRTLTKLRAKHAEAAEAGQTCSFGINGESGGWGGVGVQGGGECRGGRGGGQGGSRAASASTGNQVRKVCSPSSRLLVMALALSKTANEMIGRISLGQDKTLHGRPLLFIARTRP